MPFWHYLPGDSIRSPKVEGSGLQDLHHPPPPKKKDKQTILQTSILTGYRLEVPLTPSFRSINLLEQLTVFTETSYSLDYQLIIKGCNSELTRWQRCTGWVWVKVRGLQCPLQAHQPPQIPTPSGKVLNPILLGFMEASLPKHDWLNPCPWVLVPGSSVRGVLQSRILVWIAIHFSRRSSQPRNQTWVSCIAGRFFTILTTPWWPFELNF